MKLLISALSFLFTASLTAQECSNFYLLQANKTVEMTIYNKKGDPVGKQVYTVSDVKKSGGTTTASVASEMFDKKGRSSAKGASTIKCTGGIMMMDLKMSMPQQQASQFDKADAKADNIYIEYPSNMEVGSNLKDGNLDLEIDNNGLRSSVSMKVTDRKVEGKEKITTTAGTWDCYKISYKSKMNMRTMGVGIPVNLDGTEWFAPGFGIVKTESKHGGTAITSIK